MLQASFNTCTSPISTSTMVAFRWSERIDADADNGASLFFQILLFICLRLIPTGIFPFGGNMPMGKKAMSGSGLRPRVLQLHVVSTRDQRKRSHHLIFFWQRTYLGTNAVILVGGCCCCAFHIWRLFKRTARGIVGVEEESIGPKCV